MKELKMLSFRVPHALWLEIAREAMDANRSIKDVMTDTMIAYVTAKRAQGKEP